VDLGFREIIVVRPDQPLQCHDGKRTYFWMPLDGATAVTASVAESPRPTASEPITANPDNNEPRRTNPMPPNDHRPTEQHRNGSTAASEVIDPLVEAEALRGHLQEALGRTNRLIASLRQHRRQSRAVRSAMASLRRLDHLE
jgi:hypothetical protein